MCTCGRRAVPSMYGLCVYDWACDATLRDVFLSRVSPGRLQSLPDRSRSQAIDHEHIYHERRLQHKFEVTRHRQLRLNKECVGGDREVFMNEAYYERPRERYTA